MIIALVGTFASAAGAMLLATNTSGIASQRMIGLGIALWGALTCLFLLVTGNLWRQKGNVPISIALATVLGLGGTAFVELALHGDTTVVEMTDATQGTPKTPEVEPTTTGTAEALAEEANETGAPQDAVAEAPIEVAPPPPAAAPPPPPPPPAPNPEALDEPDFDDFAPPVANTNEAEERRRREMEEAAQARADARRQREEVAAAREAAAAAAAAATPEPTGPPRMKSLPLTVVDTLIRSNLSVKRCFFNEQQRAGEMPSRVNVQFTVIQTGRVSSARVITDQYKGGPLDSCLGRAFKAIKFPAFEGESLSMNYPFVL
jgi:hypothetical protein